MLDAMERLRERDPEVLLVLVGVGRAELPEVVDRQVRDRGLVNHVEVHGWIPHTTVADYMAASSLGLIPFLPEAQFQKSIPIKMFEYMACGLPILGANVAPVSEYLEPSGAGRVFDSTRVEAFVDAILDLKRDEGTRTRMGEAGRRAVTELWNWHQMERLLLDAYDRLLTLEPEHARRAA